MGGLHRQAQLKIYLYCIDINEQQDGRSAQTGTVKDLLILH